MENANERAAGQRHLIYVVEDDEDQLIVLRQLFDGTGFDVVTESSADRVLRGVREVNPDIMLLDVMLPSAEGRDGFQLCQDIHAMPQFRELPIILVSAIARGAGPQRDKVASQVGAQDFIVKPYDPAALVQRVRELCCKPPRAAGAPQ